MKRIVFWMVALLLMSGVAMAQANRQGGRQQMDPKTRAQRMTERMVKEYSLNEDQKQQLLDVNLAWVEKMAARHSKDDKAARMTKEEREKKAAEMKKSREDYDAQLKKILTKEQYDSYVKKQAEREKQMKEGRQNRQKRQG